MGINSTIRGLASLGERLKAERTRLGWTREQMAEFGEVSRASQRLYDSSRRVPSLTYLLLLARAGADFNYLLHEATPAEYPDDYIHLSKEDLEKAFNFTCEMWQSASSQISTREDAIELYKTVVTQLNDTDPKKIDTELLIKGTSQDKKKA